MRFYNLFIITHYIYKSHSTCLCIYLFHSILLIYLIIELFESPYKCGFPASINQRSKLQASKRNFYQKHDFIICRCILFLLQCFPNDKKKIWLVSSYNWKDPFHYNRIMVML